MSITHEVEELAADQFRCRILDSGAPVDYGRVIELWRTSAAFRSDFNRVLADSPLDAFRWETPPITINTLGREFEFVLLSAASFIDRPTDSVSFAEFFTTDNANEGVVAFANLRGDSTLVVPSPRTHETAYGHLASFVRSAPPTQCDAFWRVLGAEVHRALDARPLWVSTAGGGVAWLHARLDRHPKYYQHRPYRDA
ncbi:hypothetical protein Pla123a_21230 [Posidoniimonas polymericola]|uniref:Uncharacterized protein n=1 Tax=Posidoniimonas polymericola TaxID=2528002 RepID=A0A5C5YR91_9BACT|nr:hypothetical protein [Posidoniimonas polymericola]TWT77462.1 hypothetical protein Pla123a_21230 [Posidoniimonas polymericola]